MVMLWACGCKRIGIPADTQYVPARYKVLFRGKQLEANFFR
jgi:hypothetical protein